MESIQRRRSPSVGMALLLGIALVVPSAAAPQTASQAPRTLTAIQATLQSEGTLLEFWIEGDRSGVRHFRMTEPERLVLDVPDAISRLPSHRLHIGTEAVARLRIGQHGEKVRVVVDAAEAGGEVFRGARLVETERGVALIIGEASVVGLPRAAGRSATALAPEATTGAPGQLGEVTAELRQASSELRRAAKDLRDARLAGGEPRATPVAVAPPVPSPAPERQRSSAPEKQGSGAPEMQRSGAATPEPSQVAALPPPRQPELRESADRSAGAGPGDAGVVPVSEVTYQTVMDWIDTNRGAVPEFRAGEMIRRADTGKLQPFYPPGYYHQLLFDGVEVEIQATQDVQPHASYQQATLQYGGQTQVAEDGSVTNYVAGLPFPDERIREASPRDAGYMVAWNNIYRWGGSGWRSTDIPMVYLAPGDGSTHAPIYQGILEGGGHVERSVGMEYHRVYLSHLAHYADQGHVMKVADADKQHFKDWIQFSEPFDMRGLAFVFERFRDPHEPDQVNSYLPTERRIRRLSAKERSDSFVGSEMTMDDFEGFSGRVLDYDWKYVGEKSVMHVTNSKWDHSRYHGPQSHLPRDRWQQRRCHVVESRPLYPGHPYGRKLTFYDAQTFNIAANVIFDREDRLLKIIYTIYNWPGGAPSGAPEATVTHWRGSTVVNTQSQRSLVSWGIDVEVPVMTASKVRRLFSVSNLTGGR